MGKDVDVGIPQPFEVDLDIFSSLPINISMGSQVDLKSEIDMGLDNVKVEADVGLDDVNIDANVGLNGSLDLGLDDVNVDLGLDNINACLSFAVKELPSMRVHFPTDYEFGLKLFGLSVFNFHICGKSMIVTEDNPRKIFYTPARRDARGDAGGDSAEGSFKVTLEDK